MTTLEAPDVRRLISRVECLYPTPTQVCRDIVRKRGKIKNSVRRQCKEEGKNSVLGHYLSHTATSSNLIVSVFDARFREEEAFVAVVTPEIVFVGDQVVDLFLRRGVHPFQLV